MELSHLVGKQIIIQSLFWSLRQFYNGYRGTLFNQVIGELIDSLFQIFLVPMLVRLPEIIIGDEIDPTTLQGNFFEVGDKPATFSFPISKASEADAMQAFLTGLQGFFLTLSDVKRFRCIVQD